MELLCSEGLNIIELVLRMLMEKEWLFMHEPLKSYMIRSKTPRR